MACRLPLTGLWSARRSSRVRWVRHSVRVRSVRRALLQCACGSPLMQCACGWLVAPCARSVRHSARVPSVRSPLCARVIGCRPVRVGLPCWSARVRSASWSWSGLRARAETHRSAREVLARQSAAVWSPLHMRVVSSPTGARRRLYCTCSNAVCV